MADKSVMAGKPFYRKILLGAVEQVYDDEGNCLSQEFIDFEGKVDRRIIREDGDAVDESELEDDELIEHPDDLAMLEQQEKYFPPDMVQPE